MTHVVRSSNANASPSGFTFVAVGVTFTGTLKSSYMMLQAERASSPATDYYEKSAIRTWQQSRALPSRSHLLLLAADAFGP
jgi:hypothetical protein